VAGVDARRATIVEVAQLAGVSHQTVSRYLRFQGAGMKPPTQERVRAAIEELDYRPNLAARAMRTRHTGRLAVLLPEGSAHTSVDLLEGVRGVAHDSGYDIDVVTVGGALHARGQRVLELVESGLFEGLLSLTPLEPGIAETPAGPPVEVFGIYDSAFRSMGKLAGGEPIIELIERLAAEGHRTFLHVAGDYAYESARQRRDVYVATIERLGLESYGVVDCEWLPERSMQAILDLPATSGVTAVIAANDLLAAGVVRGATMRGWRIPEDLSVTGFDVNELGAWLSPSLTSVRIDHVRMGRDAMAQLIAVLRDEPAPVDEIPYMSVVWHNSVGPAPTTTDN